MKLDVDLTLLWSAVKKMGAQAQSIDLDNIWSDDEIAFDRELSSGGVDISLDDIEVTQGLLSARGRQVVLFIPDHGSRIDSVLDDGAQGNKFHIADCDTLDNMKKQKRFQRYKVIQNLSGEFPIFGTSLFGTEKRGNVRLNVCQNCLKKLNYKNADTNGSTYRHALVRAFNMAEFFSTYSSLFKSLPAQTIEQAQSGYSGDWEQISYHMRERHGFICQCCRVDLSQYKGLLHVHHMNGEKSDNRDENLKVLCADCHRKEPFHGHMTVKRKDMQTLTKLRKQQGLDQQASWAQVIKQVDPALLGVLAYCRRRAMPIPVAGFELKEANGKDVAMLELAWPDQKEGISLGDNLQVAGWKIYDLAQALQRFR